MSARKKERPASRLDPKWNVLEYPTGEHRVRIVGRNAKLRQRYVELSKHIDIFYETIHDATGSERFNRAFCMLDDAREELWQEMVRAGILHDVKVQ
jgi:hypothetical protein